MSSIRDRLRRFHQGYVRFVEGQGFLVILATCVAIVIGTAVWTGQSGGLTRSSPTPPVDQALSAAQVQQQSLAEVASPTPAPEVTASVFLPPLDELVVMVPFDAARLRRSSVTGLWRLHDAVDLQCAAGDVIRAMADGVVVDLREASTEGCRVDVDHGGGVTARYACMAALTGLRVGDPVAAGQTLGFAGSVDSSERDAGVHLHLRVTRDGKSIDPLLLLP